MKVLHFADLHLGVETYGRIDPATGMSSRLVDFLRAFDQLVDFALGNSVDLVIFSGDAYKSREPTPTQQREFARRINRLAGGGIAVFLLTGNHDLPNGIGRATATEIFDTLAIKNIYVSNRADVYKISTPGGIIQVASLPWVRRSALLAREADRNLSLEQMNRRLQEILTGVLAELASRLDPSLPAVLAAHAGVFGATVGSEMTMAIGNEYLLLLSNIASPAFDYVALGHIHKHQVLSQNPPVVYSGSLARLDFGEEGDEKGFYIIEIASGCGKRAVSFGFHPVAGRRFLTISLSIPEDEPNPATAILSAVASRRDDIEDAIVRVQVELPEAAAAQLRDAELKSLLKQAHYSSIATKIRRETRLRLGNLSAEGITPLEALKRYLASSGASAERARVLLEYGEKLLASRQK